MLFNSLHFVVFFPAVVALYFFAPHRYRAYFLLAASYYFYAAWRIEYLGLLVASTAIDYWAALRIGASESPRARRSYLVLSLCANLGILFWFKYLGFVAEVAALLTSPLGVVLDRPAALLLPVGISFYTFQTISYTVDVFRGRIQPERRFHRFALYVAFFPQLVAGPIERAGRLLPQFDVVHRFERSRVLNGLTLAMWGFFQKLVIADRLAPYVNRVFDDPHGQTAGAVLLGSYLFYFQLYADFSGYTDIARGTARVLGFELMRNFRRPYFARSINDFWSRWHLSLTTWFRDYLYAWLRGDRRASRAQWFRARNVMIVFFAIGLWHGAGWTFIVAGVLHGMYLSSAPLLAPIRKRMWTAMERAADRIGGGSAVRFAQPWVAMLVTYHLVTLTFLFLRANSLADALTLLRSLGGGAGSLTAILSVGALKLAIAGVAVLTLLGVHVLERRAPLEVLLLSQPRWVRWGTFYALLAFTLMLGEFGVDAFYYFQF